MPFLIWVESTGIATWVREANSLWAYPAVITFHSIGLAIMVGLSAMIDLRLIGCAPKLPLAGLRSLNQWIWIGFWVNAVSGLALLVASATTMLVNPLYYAKMGLVAVAMTIVILINKAAFGPSGVTSNEVTPRTRTLAIASLAVWAVTITVGRLTAYLGN
ncbi:MAG: hypothetical protein Q7J25_02655 [Vicinamibacterales bacterium]|nr:hypothetical protein [Vicinamibacterales bacterium]